MKRLRAHVLVTASCVVLSAVWAADTAPPVDPNRVENLANKAMQNAQKPPFDFSKLVVPKYADQDHVKELANTGRQRGDAQFQVLKQQRQDAAAAAGVELPEDKPKPGEAREPVAGRLVVALSSSMPDKMLHDYMVQLDNKPEAIVVLRGFVGGAKTVGPTGILIEQARRKSAADRHKGHFMVDVVVDPLVYQSLGIDKVPAVAWLDGVQDIRHCDQESFNASVVAYGATNIETALKEIKRNGGSVPDAVIKKFEGKPW